MYDSYWEKDGFSFVFLLYIIYIRTTTKRDMRCSSAPASIQFTIQTKLIESRVGETLVSSGLKKASPTPSRSKQPSVVGLVGLGLSSKTKYGV